MAKPKKPTMTHVLEIEAGIGEPAFLPLSLGEEIQPISVGKKGMWRLESARVLDVHAFVYFDGEALFLQSAEDSSAPVVDGYEVGKTWTELHAPCTIEIGSARLRYRSLIENADIETTIALQGKVPTGEAGVLPPTPSNPPVRPFKPGEFAQTGSGSTRVVQKTSPSQPPPPNPAANAARVDPQETTALMPLPPPTEAKAALVSANASADVPGTAKGHSVPPPAYPPPMSVPPGMPPMSVPPGVGPAMPQGTHPGMHHPGFAPQGIPMGMGTHPGMPMGTHPGMPMPLPMGAPTPPPPETSLLDKWRAFSIPKRIFVILAPFSFAAGIFMLFDEDPPPPRKRPDVTDAGATASAASAASAVPPPATAVPPAATTVAWPPGVPCPPPNWPPNVPLPCVPNDIPIAPTATKDAGSKEPASSKERNAERTLERQAVDYVATGDILRAAATYDELARRNPGNRVYAEAARILRAKLDAGAP